MTLLVDLFPFLVIVVAVVVVGLAVRLDRRLSRGAYSAGPFEIERAKPTGQERTPWELKAIEDQLSLARPPGGSAAPRYELTATVNRLIIAAGLPSRDQVPLTADVDQLAVAITKIEARLDLPALAESPRRA